jgi:serine phosphatase RsbU (regulator of sigma subunit)
VVVGDVVVVRGLVARGGDRLRRRGDRQRGSDAEELRARGTPLGLMPGMRYEQKEMVLEADEIVLLYSDGLVDAHGPKGEKFGFSRLRAIVAEHDEERSLGEKRLAELHSFVGEGWEQEDDITLLTLRRQDR